MKVYAGKKSPKSVFMVCLIFAIIGSFAFSANQVFSYEKPDRDTLDSDIYYSSIYQSPDWLAADTPSIGKSNRYSNSLLRNILFRVFSHTGTNRVAVFPGKSNFKINKNDNFLTIKNYVPLKLRI